MGHEGVIRRCLAGDSDPRPKQSRSSGDRVREVQPFHGGEAGELGPAVVAAGGEQGGVAHEALDLDGVDAGVVEVGGEGPPSVMGAEVANAGLAGPAVDEGVDGLRGEAPRRYPSRFVDRVEQGALVRASDLEPGGQRSASASGKGAAALAPALAGNGEVAAV